MQGSESTTVIKELRTQAKELAPLIQERLQKLLHSQGIGEAVIVYRIKEENSIQRKTQQRHCRAQELTDILGFRIIVPAREHCYQVLGAVHEVFLYLPHKVKDYIKSPKENGYQSLHTTFYTNNFMTELQIRTMEMHHEAEHGLAQYRPAVEEQKTTGIIARNGITLTTPNNFPRTHF